MLKQGGEGTGGSSNVFTAEGRDLWCTAEQNLVAIQITHVHSFTFRPPKEQCV